MLGKMTLKKKKEQLKITWEVGAGISDMYWGNQQMRESSFLERKKNYCRRVSDRTIKDKC